MKPAGPTTLMRPDYGGACITEVVPNLLRRHESGHEAPSWMPAVLHHAPQVVLVVLDGLGWEQLQANRDDAPTLASMAGGAITSVAPTTTATALTSIVSGRPPSDHGVVGYRLRADEQVLNILKWTTPAGDARLSIPPAQFQPLQPFLGRKPPVVSRAEFEGTGFTDAHLPGVPLAGWRMPSSLVVEVHRLLAEGHSFVYAYYDGIDKIAHDKGLGEHYRAELRAADHLVASILEGLPPGAALAVTADHGQVEVLREPIALEESIIRHLQGFSGEGRFRWLHVIPGLLDSVVEEANEHYGAVAFVRTRQQLIDQGYFGGSLSDEFASRLGDVALIAREDVAFFDPSDTGELRLVARHGALTSAEMYVPLLGASN